MRGRPTYLALALATIVLGLLIHLRGTSLGPTAQDIIGDVLYAMMVAWFMGALTPTAHLITRATAAYTLCAIIEASQLWHAPLVDAMRAIRIGQLVLGSGFNARDLASYALGVGAAALLELAARRKRQPAHN